MPNKLMMVFFGADFLFACCGGLLIGFSLIAESAIHASPTISNVAQQLLLKECPLTGGVVNAIFVFITFLFSFPALFLPQNRGWLRAQGWFVVFCATFTLVLGVVVWFTTLQSRAHLGAIWAKETPLTQSLLQQKFSCCGYQNSTSPMFVQDSTCTNSLVAAQKPGCISAFSSFANGYMDLIFTAAFGIVGVDVLLVLCVAMVLKYRQEQERYRHIDEKNRLGGL